MIIVIKNGIIHYFVKKILPILMEPDMINYYNKNNGIVQMYLNNSLYIDFSNNFHDNFHKLIKSLQYYQVFPILNVIYVFIKIDKI